MVPLPEFSLLYSLLYPLSVVAVVAILNTTVRVSVQICMCNEEIEGMRAQARIRSVCCKWDITTQIGEYEKKTMKLLAEKKKRGKGYPDI